MNTRRGMTLLESVLSLMLFSVLSMTALSTWRYATNRSLQDATLARLTLQSNQVLDAMTNDIRTAAFCETRLLGSNTVLLVALPENGVDLTSDGVSDYYTPSSVSYEGIARTRPGSFRWYGMASTTWDYSGTIDRFKRQTSTRDRLPTDPLDSFDTAFNTEYFGSGHAGVPRYRLIESVTFSVDSVARCVTITVVASNRYRNRGMNRDTTVNGTDVARITTTRVVFWRNGF